MLAPKTFVTEAFRLFGVWVHEDRPIAIDLENVSAIPPVGLHTGKATRRTGCIFSGRLTSIIIDCDLPGSDIEC